MDRQEKELIKISVRNLVEFILRKGDLDNRRSAAFDREAMLKGGRIHRKIQKQMNASYRAEVPLKWEQEYEEFIISVEGRADGIIEETDRTAIDEIKGVYMDLNYLEEPIEVHKAQAMCYAYIYGSQSGKDKIQVQMTYCQMESEEIKRFIIEDMERGATYLKGKGMFTDRDKDVIFLVISRKEVHLVQNRIREIDPRAFVVVTDAYETFGEGFKQFPDKNQIQAE